MWFSPGKQLRGYTHKANILPDLAVSLHIPLVNRGNGYLALETLISSITEAGPTVSDIVHDNK